VAAGEVVFEQGTRGELVYVIETGRVEVFRQRADGTSEPLAELGDGDYFGELGPLLGFPRSATARALTPLRLVAYNVHDFREQVVGKTAGASRTR
jgi:putative ABC transport system ATP-binding protein